MHLTLKSCRPLPLLIFLIAPMMWLQAQSTAFTVIKVNGKVYSNSLQRVVKAGDVIRPADKLVFDARSSYLHVVNSQQGRKTIRNVDDKSPHELMQLMEKFLANDRASKNSRGAGNGIEILRQQLSQDTVLILTDGLIKIDTSQFSLKNPSGIVATYQWTKKNITRNISVPGGFSLTQSSLFDPSIGSQFPKVIVYHCQNLNDMVFSDITLLGSFVPRYVDEGALNDEVKSIIDSYPQTTTINPAIFSEIVKYISAEYAPPVEVNLTAWLKARNLTN